MLYTITEREKEIVCLIADEYSSKQIANKLSISYETVRSHRRNLLSKMNVKNVAGLVRKAFECKLLVLRESSEDNSN